MVGVEGDGMRILMVNNTNPAGARTGGHRRVEEVLLGLSRHHEVTFCTVADRTPASDEVDPRWADIDVRLAPAPGAVTRLVRRASWVGQRVPYHVALYRSADLSGNVAGLLERRTYDLVYVHFLRSLQYVPASCPLPIVLDQHNVDRQIWETRARHAEGVVEPLVARLNHRRTVRYEEAMEARVSAWVSVSEEDARATRTYSSKPVFVAPNGVDTEVFRPQEAPEGDEDRDTLGFLGSMDLEQNVAGVRFLVEDVLPRVTVRRPVRLLVIGRNPSPEIRNLRTPDWCTLEVTGTVDSVPEWLARIDVFCGSVLWGGGTKLKMLESMAMGLPIVATEHAAQGLAATHERHLLVAGNAEEYAAALDRLLRDGEARREMGKRARALVEEHYRWEAITDRLSGDLVELAGGRR